jgi:hypothetical protein
MKNTLFIPLTIIFLIALACSTSEKEALEKKFGKQINKNGLQLFYTDKITEEEANRMVNFLIESEFVDGEKKTIQLNKNGKTYEFRLVVKKGIEQDQEYIELSKIFTLELSKFVFNNSPVDIHMCDELLNTIRVIPMSTASIEENSFEEVSYTSAYPPDLVQNFMNACMKNGSNQEFCSCVLDKIQSNFTLEQFTEIENGMANGTNFPEFVQFTKKASEECRRSFN